MIQNLIDPEVPRGGIIRETLGWEASVPDHGIATHTFYLLSFYGVGTTIEQILANVIAYNYITVTTTSMSRISNIDTPIDVEAPLGTFSCATIIAESFDGATINGIYDFKVDANVLTITPGLGAKIISTSFTKI